MSWAGLFFDTLVNCNLHILGQKVVVSVCECKGMCPGVSHPVVASSRTSGDVHAQLKYDFMIIAICIWQLEENRVC